MTSRFTGGQVKVEEACPQLVPESEGPIVGLWSFLSTTEVFFLVPTGGGKGGYVGLW